MNSVHYPARAYRRFSDVQEFVSSSRAEGLRKTDDSQILDGIVDNLASASHEDKVPIAKMLHALEQVGLRPTDPRLSNMMKKLSRKLKDQTTDPTSQAEDMVMALFEEDKCFADKYLSKEDVKECLEACVVLVTKAFRNELIIPEPVIFMDQIRAIYDKCKPNEEGDIIGDSFKMFENFRRDQWGVAICTVDGQRFCLGDTNITIPLKTLVTPINYAVALTTRGEKEVHKYVGQEPSGRSHNEISLDTHQKPHNPLIDTGSTVVVSMLLPNGIPADRFDEIQQTFKKLAGNEEIGYNNSYYLAKKASADRNMALGYFMKENNCFPESKSTLKENLELYFSLLALEATPDTISVIAASLANGGICPITGERVLDPAAVRNTLSVMYSCGMYDYSGKFSFYIGLPAKSSLTGTIMLIVPNVMGICLFSPPLDEFHNSVRGIQFCNELIKMFAFHNYDSMLCNSEKIDPVQHYSEDNQAIQIVNLLFAASEGDMRAMYRFYLNNFDMNAADYDGRTALHLAAAEGRIEVVRFLLEICKVNVLPRDRWQFTPRDDAIKFSHKDIAKILEAAEKMAPIAEQ